MNNVQRVESYIENLKLNTDSDVISLDDIIVHHRSNNKKRDYLFVNALQGKHIPASPSRVYKMTKALADKIDGLHKGDKVVVIGFAETATGLGNLVGEELKNKGLDVEILQTTREDVIGINLVDFEEEHSHATSQKLVIQNEFDLVYMNDILSRKCFIIVEDEITTGNTVINMVSKLKKKLTNPDVRFVVASVCNWQSDADIQRFKDNGIEAISLISGQIKNKDIKMIDIDDTLSERLNSVDDSKEELSDVEKEFLKGFKLALNTSVGVKVMANVERTGHKPYIVYDGVFNAIIDAIKFKTIDKINTIRIIGTEEFMGYPLKIGAMLEKELGCNVRFHATTRSPIDIINNGNDKGIVNGIKLDRKGQEASRFLYNIDKNQDLVIVMSDMYMDKDYTEQIASAFKYQGFEPCDILFITLF